MMISRSLQKRRYADLLINLISTLSALIGIALLIWILTVVIVKGIGAINWSFFTQLPTPPGISGGGLANAILGTIIITVFAALFSIPFGIGAGIYLAEFGKGTKFASIIRFITNVLVGVPSIIVGVFVYTMLVVPMKNFSGLSGAIALAIIMLPVIIRTTEDILLMVPDALRESSLALGVPRWRTTLNIVFRAAKTGLLTGVLLAVARVSGETAPLLFTALNSPYWIDSLFRPMANLTVTIFNYAMSPYADWQKLAWGASLLVTASVLIITIAARVLISTKQRNR